MTGATGEAEGGRERVNVGWDEVNAFRLARHHLVERASKSELTSVLSGMAGAQAQVLSAASTSLWARVNDLRTEDMESAMWEEKTVVRTSCMRRTLYLVPASEASTFVRGSVRRAGYEVRYILRRGVPAGDLESLLEVVLDSLEEPASAAVLAKKVSKESGLPLKFRRGGGWGSEGEVACVEVGGLTLSAGYLVHVASARGVICSGPRLGSQSTFVRADSWTPHWKDVTVERAEKALVTKYLRAFGPSTVSDFAWWVGLYAGDAKEIWSRVADDLVPVEVQGWKAWALRSDIDELENASTGARTVRLLPHFDSFLLGHRTKQHLVDERDRGKVYRGQGWVSPVLLVDGRARGVWSHVKNGPRLRVEVREFKGLPKDAESLARSEAESLGRFLGLPAVATSMSKG